MSHSLTARVIRIATVSLSFGTGAFTPSVGFAAPESHTAIQLVTFRTHSRLMIRVDESVPVELERLPQGFKIRLKGTALNDLGAPMGDEDRWKALYQSLSDSRAGTLEIKEEPSGVLISGKWKFPSGTLALADPSMESFTYRETTPPRYVVDFWLKKGPTRIEAEQIKRNAAHLAALNKTREEARKKIARTLAAEKHRAEVSNVGAFCNKPVTEKNDIFLEFNAVHTPFNFSKYFFARSADQRFHYFKPEREEKDAQYVRLALELYAKGNPGLAIRTLDFLKEEFPHSEYLPQMNFLRANCLIKLGIQQAGESILSQIIQADPKRPIALHSAMYLTGRAMAAGDIQKAMQGFMWLVRHYSSHDLAWVFHMGVAECLYALREVEPTAKEYRWVMEHAPNDTHKSEAAFRLGDLYQVRRQYAQSLASYFTALNYFPKQAKNFPVFFLNRAESLYQLKQYDRAKSALTDFLESFPAHPMGWRATLRLAEIHGRQEATSEPSSKARTWYYETINRFPLSPGATLARMRLLPCGDHGGFDLAAALRFFQESKDFTGNDEVFLKGYSDMRALTRVRSLMALSTEDQTALAAIFELPNAKAEFVQRNLVTIANGFFQKTILRLLANNRPYEALSYYTSVAPMVPDAESVTDLDYLLRLSQAASDLGLGSFAKKLTDVYLAKVKRQNKFERVALALKGEQAADLIEAERMDSELRASEVNFTEAKARYISEVEKARAEKSQDGKELELRAQTDSELAAIKDLLLKVKDESRFSYQKEVLLGLVLQREGKTEEAIQHLSKVQLVGNSLRSDLLLARLEEGRQNLDVALSMYQNIEKKIILKEKLKDESMDPADGLVGLPSTPTLAQIFSGEAAILEKQGRWQDLIALYERAFQADLKTAPFKYAYARALYYQASVDQNGVTAERARKAMEDLSSEKQEFWKKLAEENLANTKSIGKFIAIAKEGTK